MRRGAGDNIVLSDDQFEEELEAALRILTMCSQIVLSTNPGTFRAPQWLPNQGPNREELVMFVESKNGPLQRIMLAEAKAGGRSKEVVETVGFTSFAVAP